MGLGEGGVVEVEAGAEVEVDIETMTSTPRLPRRASRDTVAQV